MTPVEEDDLRARVGAVGMLAMALEVQTRIASQSLGDEDLRRRLAGAHGRALEVMVRLRQELRQARVGRGGAA